MFRALGQRVVDTSCVQRLNVMGYYFVITSETKSGGPSFSPSYSPILQNVHSLANFSLT